MNHTICSLRPWYVFFSGALISIATFCTTITLAHAAPAYATITALSTDHNERLITITFPVTAKADMRLPLTAIQILGTDTNEQYNRYKKGRLRVTDTVHPVLLLSNSAPIKNGMYTLEEGDMATFTIVSVLNTSSRIRGAYYVTTHKSSASSTAATSTLKLATDSDLK